MNIPGNGTEALQLSTTSVHDRLDLSSFPCVVIDDKQEDALAILWALQGAGLSCTPLIYDGMSGLLNAKEHHLEGTRIVFLDLNLLRDSTSSVQTMATHISSALKDLGLQGPYLLVIWSNYNAEPSEVLPPAFKQAGIPCPVDIVKMPKEQFRSQPEGESWDSSRISAKIKEMLEGHPQIRALMAWENRIFSAAKATTEVLFRTARKPCQSSCLLSAPAETRERVEGLTDMSAQTQSEREPERTTEQPTSISEGQSVPEAKANADTQPTAASTPNPVCGEVASKSSLSEVLCAIAQASFGEHAQNQSQAAIEIGLLPLIEDRLLSTRIEGEYSVVWQKALEGGWDSPLAERERGVLNTYLLLDCNNPPISDRGLWFDLHGAGGNPLKSLFGVQPNDLLMAFLNLEPLYQGDASEKQLARDLKAKCKIGLLECSAACDHAWGKAKSKLGLLGAIIPVAVEHKYIRKHKGIYELPLFRLGEEDYHALISFRHVCGIVPRSLKQWIDERKTLFRIREQLLGDIAAHFAAHITRPGTISLGNLVVSPQYRE